MTPEAQRIAIAEVCQSLFIVNTGTFSDNVLYWNDKELCGPAVDPLSNLNAMHEAEKVLTGEQLTQYARKLIDIKDRDEGNGEIEPTDVLSPIEVVAWILRATATQRAEAFLRTLNLWDDSK